MPSSYFNEAFCFEEGGGLRCLLRIIQEGGLGRQAGHYNARKPKLLHAVQAKGEHHVGDGEATSEE